MAWLAPLALLALGGALLATSQRTASAHEDDCPDGPAAVASHEPIEVLGGQARVAFTLAPGCRDVWVSLLSHRPAGVPGPPQQPLLDLVTGRFSAGDVYRLTVDVLDDCNFRVSFVVGPATPGGHGGSSLDLVEAILQDPDACSMGAAPVVVTPTPEPGPAPVGGGASPRTTLPAPAPGVAPLPSPRASAGEPPQPGDQAAAAAGPRPRAGAGSPSAAAKRKAERRAAGGAAIGSLAQAERAAAIAAAADQIVEPDGASPFAGVSGMMLLTALSALTAGGLLLRLTRRGGAHAR